MPVGQVDGGRDAVSRSASDYIVFQVKWAGERPTSPAAWLAEALTNEEPKIARLAAEGATKYILITNVRGTSARSSGTIDRLQSILDGLSNRHKINVSCWWQTDVDARVDAAPNSLKWAYSDMLAGNDLVYYLVHCEFAAKNEYDEFANVDAQTYLTLKHIIAQQWYEDRRVKFKQVELDAYDLNDLFIDIEAVRTIAPVVHPDLELGQLGGAARYLADTEQGFTFIHGDPGQGKSTLVQYLCQAHRAKFLAGRQFEGQKTPKLFVRNQRVPLRVDLRDFATWMLGRDPFSETETKLPSGKPRPATFEKFVAFYFRARGGGQAIPVKAIVRMLDRFPMLIVLDGLDEVADEDVRASIVSEINRFSIRLNAAMHPPQIIVTARPNASGLQEPAREGFETIRLQKLNESLTKSYLRKWSDAHGIDSRDRRALLREFAVRASDPQVAQLTENPMQLSILLFLMYRIAEAVPRSRTHLYSMYMETLLAREAQKSELVRKYREDLEEVTAFLGWCFQAESEADPTQTRMTARKIRGLINQYLFDTGRSESRVGELFTAVTDRVWALTSKIEGTFEFDVMSVQEYFAARYLWDFAGAEISHFDRSEVAKHLLMTSYWLNTCRFFVGFARPNEVSDLVDAVEDVLSSAERLVQVRIGAWTLLSEGAFHDRRRPQRRAEEMFSEDLSTVLLHDAMVEERGVKKITPGLGGEYFRRSLEQQLELNPTSALAHVRARLLSELFSSDHFDRWWVNALPQYVGTSEEHAFLRLRAGEQRPAPVDNHVVSRLDVSSRNGINATLASGVVTDTLWPSQSIFTNAVLAGACSNTIARGSGDGVDLAAICSPVNYIRMAIGTQTSLFTGVTGHPHDERDPATLKRSISRLAAKDRRFQHVRVPPAGVVSKRESTSSPWVSTANALRNIYGPNWASVEILVIAASAIVAGELELRSPSARNASTFRPDADQGFVLEQVVNHQGDAAWWSRALEAADGGLAIAMCLAFIVCTASSTVIDRLVSQLASAFAALDEVRVYAILNASSRIGASRLRRELSPSIVRKAQRHSSILAMLAAHHVVVPGVSSDLALELPFEYRLDHCSWPVAQYLWGRVAADPSDENVVAARACLPSYVRIESEAFNEHPSLFEAVISLPSAFPLAWVTSAAAHQMGISVAPPMMEVAASAGWFAL